MQTKDKTTKYVNVEVFNEIEIRVGYTYKKLYDIGVFYKYYSGGASKDAQIKELETLGDITKVNTKYFINEKYTEVKAKVDRRGGNNNTFMEDITKLIKYECATSKTKTYAFDLTLNGLSQKLGMINNNYTDGRYHKNEISMKYLIPKEDLSSYYSNLKTRNKSRIEAALNNMQNKNLIVWNYSYNIYDSEDKEYRKATDLEIATILDCQNEVLDNSETFKKYNGEMQKIYKSGKAPLFYKEVKKLLDEQGYTFIGFYFKSYHVITSSKFRKMALEEHESIKQSLNNKVIKAFLKKFGDENIEQAKKFADIFLNISTKIQVNNDIHGMDKETYLNRDGSISAPISQEFYEDLMGL